MYLHCKKREKMKKLIGLQCNFRPISTEVNPIKFNSHVTEYRTTKIFFINNLYLM